MDTFLTELRNAYFAELQHGSGAILNTEFAAVGSLRLRIIDQIVRNIVDVKLNFSDVLQAAENEPCATPEWRKERREHACSRRRA